jgi:hypothetical protein
MKLLFEASGASWTISCDRERAPNTLAALARALPLPLQLHTPKIAGNHIYWHAPFIETVEGGTAVLDASPGAFIYWPVRQFLEITYAPLQAETATVTVLGHLDGPADGIQALAEQLRRNQGTKPFNGRLAISGASDSNRNAFVPKGLPAHLLAARRALWAACPEDIAALPRSRAIMHPAGPCFMADGEARGLHETLWWIRERLGSEDAAKLSFATALALNRTAVRLRDFCHFTSSSEVLFAYERAVTEHANLLAALLDEAILCAGRISAWIDLQIPWNDVNEGFRSALGTHPPEANTRAVG